MNSKKMKSLNEFKMSQKEMNSTKGGHIDRWGITWLGGLEGDVNIYYTGSIGTYEDGMSTGTDGYED